MESFGSRLKQLRKERGITLQSMSEYLGISMRAYQYYESGGRYPEFHGLIALADFFEVSLDYLVGRSDIK